MDSLTPVERHEGAVAQVKSRSPEQLKRESALAGIKGPAYSGFWRSSISIRELHRGCLQFAGYGGGTTLAAWLTTEFGVCPSPNTVVDVLSGRAKLAAVAPATWLLMFPAGALNGFSFDASRRLGDAGALTDFSDGRNSFIEIAGPQAADVLAKYIDIDFEGGTLGPNCCASTGIHAMPALVICHRSDLFEVSVHRSLAYSLVETVLDAAAEFGVVLEQAGR